MRKIEKWLPGLLFFVVLLTSILGGTAYGKYVTEEKMEGTISIRAELGSITVQEHEAVKNEDGSYKLGDDTTTEGNTYTIIPGLDIPKDPYVTLDVNAIPVYVYIIVEQDFTNSVNGISYELEDCWRPVAGASNVYVYSDNNVPVAVDADMVIDILKNDKIYVSQHLTANVRNSVSLKFTAAMLQVVDGQTAAEIYLGNNN